ncbi:MAG TPA: BON domain-containing protein [Blastocatellia bacterium]|nr:BON domain-containing protein [Blastocatellia bacterium]
MKLRMKTIKKIFGLATLLVICAATASAATLSADDDGPNTGAEKQIRKKLVTLPFYGVFDNLNFSVEGDTVVLSGQVIRPTTRKDAERRVARIEGVEHVVNNIQVLPVSTFDDRIRIRAYRKIFRTGSLYRYSLGANPSIHIIVNRGHLTLEGVVGTKMDSQLAYIAASQVPEVFSVTNNLRIEKGGY